MVRAPLPLADQSSPPPQDGVFLTSQQLLVFIKIVQEATLASRPPHPESGLACQCDSCTHPIGKPLEGSSSVDNVGNAKKRHSQDEPTPFLPNKRGEPTTPIHVRGVCWQCGAEDHKYKKCLEYPICGYCKRFGHPIALCPKIKNKKEKRLALMTKTPTIGRGACCNCGSMNHYVHECPIILFCRYCERDGHILSSCQILLNRRGEESNDPPLDQGTFHSSFGVIIIFHNFLPFF